LACGLLAGAEQVFSYPPQLFFGSCFIFLALFSSQILPPNFTMQKGDFPSHQNTGKCMEY
jgi:hypothetical protein